MTTSDVKAVQTFGKQIATCIGRIASIALALAAHCNDSELRDAALEEIKRVNERMTEILDTFTIGRSGQGFDA